MLNNVVILHRHLLSQLDKVIQNYKINYRYGVNYSTCHFKLENEKIFDNDKIACILILYDIVGTYSLMITIDGHIEKTLNKLSYFQISYILDILIEKSNSCSFPNALKELCQYNKIKEMEEEEKQ